MTVLIVEDDPALARLMTAVFRRLGLETEHAGRGDAAIEAISSSAGRFGAIILDLMLPAVSGFEILEHVARTDPETLNRGIVVTAASNAVLEKIKKGPAPRRIIRKPFELEELRSA